MNSYGASYAGKKFAHQSYKKKASLLANIALTILSEDSMYLSVKMRNVSGVALEASQHCSHILAIYCWLLLAK